MLQARQGDGFQQLDILTLVDVDAVDELVDVAAQPAVGTQQRLEAVRRHELENLGQGVYQTRQVQVAQCLQDRCKIKCET